MGNAPLSTAEVAHTYGKSTQQIDGVLTLTNQRPHLENTKQQKLGLSLPWHTSKTCSTKNNKRVKSLLMKSILARDWQKVLIRARLFFKKTRKTCKTLNDHRLFVLVIHQECISPRLFFSLPEPMRRREKNPKEIRE